MQSLKDGGFDPNIADALVKLGASKALSCWARARMVETAQKTSFLVGTKKKMVLQRLSAAAVRQVTGNTYGLGLLSAPL